MRCGLSSKFVELVTVGVGLNAVIRFYNEARSGRNFVDEEFGYFSRSTERSYLGLRSVVPRRREKPTLPYRRQWRKLSVLRHQPGGPPFTPWSHRLPQGSLHMQNRRQLGPLTILYVIVILYWLLCCLRCDSTPCYKKQPFWFLLLTLANVDRFSKVSHRQIPTKTVYVQLTRSSTSSQLCCYTTLQNSKI